ncbi:MAG TPA: TraB/GumN family protein [Cyclobacteriaceae bacterium]|nr:TraB/GumN family protein [Cyclobacteriaceae bacterium]
MSTFSRFMRHIFIVLVLTTGVENLLAQHPGIDNALLWKISGNGLQKPSYLFGTYHLLNSDYLETIPKVKSAFEKSDGVVVETELDSSLMMKMMFMMVMPDKKIVDLMSEEDYALVSKEVQETMGAPINMIAQFKPTFITFMLTVAYNQSENGEVLNKYGGHPLDSHFASVARKKNKPVGTFETMEEQITMVFDHDPVEKQAEDLVTFVKSKKENLKVLPKLLKLYMDENLNDLYALSKKYERQFGETTYLTDDRNVRWMEKLPGFLNLGNQFIAVGAFHLTGNKGLISLLRDKGYKVEALASK